MFHMISGLKQNGKDNNNTVHTVSPDVHRVLCGLSTSHCPGLCPCPMNDLFQEKSQAAELRVCLRQHVYTPFSHEPVNCSTDLTRWSSVSFEHTAICHVFYSHMSYNHML